MAIEKQQAEYQRAEDYIPKFICYLQEKNVITDNKIKKDEARNLYFSEFKTKYNIKQFSFARMYSYLKYFRLITYDKNTETIIFKADALNYITPKTDIVGRKKFKIIPTLKAEQTSNIDPKPAEDEASAGPSEKERKQTAYTRKACNVCDASFTNVSSYQEHQKTELHKMRMKYVMKTNELTDSFPGVTIQVIEGHAGKPENIIVRQSEPRIVGLHILNRTEHELTVLKIKEMNGSPHYVTIEQIPLPHVIPPNFQISLEIKASFPETTFYAFPILFTLKTADSDKEVDVLKELMFHVHSELVDSLHAVEPYKKPSKPVIYDGHNEVIPGEMPDKAETDFKPKFLLPKYRLPDNITVLLNNKLEEFPDMSRPQRNILKDIRKLLSDFKKQTTLNKQNYFRMCELFLFMEEYQMRINIRTYDVDDQQLTVPLNSPRKCLELSVPGLAEARPSLLRGDSVFIKEHKLSDVKYEGIVHKVHLSSVVLGFSNRFIHNVHTKNKKYSVSFSFNRVALRAEHQAIELAKKHNIVHFLCPNKVETRPLKSHRITWHNKSIVNNDHQVQAVRHILSETSRPVPYLIFGPPGTGKTVTIVEAILQIWSIRTQNMLVCTPSNYAADEIAKRLVVHVPQEDLLRYVALSYNYNFIDDSIKPYTNYKDGDYYHPPLAKLLTYRIVITTLVTASRLVNAGTPPNHFSYVFIDESGQATESETLIPIAGILTAAEKQGMINGQIVLAGDPKQLGPIIQSQKALEYGYGISMLERLMNNCDIYKKGNDGQYNKNVLTKLVQSYRSHHAILQVPNKLFYEGELTPCGPKSETHVALGWEDLPNKKMPVIFHGVNGKDEQEANSPSFFNVQEIDIVLNYLEKLIGHHLNGKLIKEEHIGVIAPYRKQVQKLRRAFQIKEWWNLMVGSVEQFQGQEKLIIIISTVRAKPQFTKHDAKFHLGFLQNPKRFNVAITRAKALLIVVGNPNVLQHDENWNAFIQFCKLNKCIKGVPLELMPLDEALLHLNISSSEEENVTAEVGCFRNNI